MSMGGSAGTRGESGIEESRTNQTKQSGSRQTEQLKLEDEAVEKFIQDVLGSAQGLASIFGGEQATGLFSTSVAADEAGDLAAKLVGELAQLTGERVITGTGEETLQSKTKDRFDRFALDTGAEVSGISFG